MGTWSATAFGNDFAMDWAEDLQESKDLYFIEDTLNNTLSGESAEYLEAPFGAEALAAIEVLARLYGQGGAEELEEVDEWVEEVRPKLKKVRTDLLEKAQQAMAHILSQRSELRELWQDSEHYEEWRAAVEELAARVAAVRNS